MENAIHLDLDGAWDTAGMNIRTVDLRDCGPSLRYFATSAGLKDLFRRLPEPLPPFVLYGSGDFHYLSGIWLDRAIRSPGRENVTLVSFDNHPDWDIRPPHWGCGGWINRALEMPAVRAAHVWGCGNFELALPARLFANRRALRGGRLVVHPWAERQSESTRRHYDCITRDNWKLQFEQFASGLSGANIYITVDLDCVGPDHAKTNWENGLFAPGDVAWAIRQLRQRANVFAGDVCGAYSPPEYHGLARRFIGWWDHPKLPPISLDEARRVNKVAIAAIWPALA
ncbi:MAG TPA: hypothetical protein VL992_02200 [Tepidisphaeraceae bacterium]|nr:hypothetical protein [Tepidisphaeraceae bacterium]